LVFRLQLQHRHEFVLPLQLQELDLSLDFNPLFWVDVRNVFGRENADANRNRVGRTTVHFDAEQREFLVVVVDGREHSGETTPFFLRDRRWRYGVVGRRCQFLETQAERIALAGLEARPAFNLGTGKIAAELFCC